MLVFFFFKKGFTLYYLKNAISNNKHEAMDLSQALRMRTSTTLKLGVRTRPI